MIKCGSRSAGRIFEDRCTWLSVPNGGMDRSMDYNWGGSMLEVDKDSDHRRTS